MNRLKDKRALITGGTSGIGLATAHRFLAEGARVVVTGTDPSRIDTARKDLGPEALVILSDAGDVKAQKALATAIQQRFGQLDVLFLNAGVVDLRPIDQWDEAAYDRSFSINMKGPFFLLQALLPVFANPASVVLMTSINAHIGMPTSSIYAATKAGLLSLSRTLSGELIGRGIRVNAVSPGPIATPVHFKPGMSEEQTKAMTDAMTAQIPARRFGNAAEIAEAVVFLASDECSFTVGGELIIDGGMGL